MPPLHLASLVGWATLGATTAGLGALLCLWRPAGVRRALGVAAAAAAGMMLGAGYASLSVGLSQAPLAALLGAALGVVALRALDAGTLLTAVVVDDRLPPRIARGMTTAGTLHSAVEGVAIGAAAAVNAWFGLFLVLTFAMHNVSEGAMLYSALGAAGWTVRRALSAVLLTRLGQPLLAAIAFTLAGAVPAILPWLLGASFGALLYLIIAELLPQSYLQAGRTAIALVFSLAAGVVSLLAGRAP